MSLSVLELLSIVPLGLCVALLVAYLKLFYVPTTLLSTLFELRLLSLNFQSLDFLYSRF